MTELHGKNGEPSIRERTGQLKVGFMERLRWYRADRLDILWRPSMGLDRCPAIGHRPTRVVPGLHSAWHQDLPGQEIDLLPGRLLKSTRPIKVIVSLRFSFHEKLLARLKPDSRPLRHSADLATAKCIVVLSQLTFTRKENDYRNQ